MLTPKNKFKIGKKASSASYQTPKKQVKPKTAKASSDAKKKIPEERFFGKKAPFSKTKKVYPANRTANADIIVKRSVYSKAARAAVLADAAARQRLIEMGGENTIDVIREFDRDMSDDELAKKTGIKPSEVRVVLNRLHNRGVFAYTRVRDKDSGWYSYIWKLDEGRLKDVGGAVMVEETTQMAGKEGYRCACCSQQNVMEFSEAVDARFRCGNCGSCLEFFDSKRNRVGNL
jgi:transcription initiation factor TFIIE subunit alpha